MAFLSSGTSLRLLLYLHFYPFRACSAHKCIADDPLRLYRCYAGVVCLHTIISSLGLWLGFAHVRTACIQH